MRIFKSKGIGTGVTVLGFTATLCSCHFGNYSDPYTPISQPATFSTTDLYQTHAASLSATVSRSVDINDDTIIPTNTTNNNSPMIAMPAAILDTFTSPVFYLVPTDKTKPPEFANIDLSSGIQTGSLVNNAVSYSTNDDSYYRFLTSPNCGIQSKITQSATVDTSHPDTYTFSDGSTLPVKGSLTFTITYSSNFIGDCSADLSSLATCYLNGAGCSSTMLKLATETFDLYVRAGVLNLATDDLSQIKGLEFTAKYDNN